MHNIARELNDQIRAENPHVYELLSDLGRNLYYPKGILTQTDEATEKAYRFNATIGMATEKGQPMFLPVIQETLSQYNPQDIYTYAPPAGKSKIRAVWREKLLKDNPSLQGKTMSQPIVTNALTHGLSIAADLFLNPQDVLVLPDKLWGNYTMIFGTRRNAEMRNFTFFTENGEFNTQGMKEALLAQKAQGKAVLLLNFPNNPTGYTPVEKEAQAIVEALLEVAEQGINVAVLVDDAYFGLFYEDSIKESLFGRLANIHPRILAVKVDGPTKEEYVWGFRIGFITFGDASSVVCDVLENKTKAIIRSTISNASHPAQTFVLHALASPDFEKQKQEKYKIMEGRALKVKEILNRGDYQDLWDYYPFNSGYFMCLKLKGVKAEELRLHLLHNYGVGVIALGESDIRVAFSCVEEEDLEELFKLIYQGAKDLA
ncbi:aspartate/methionine/tyrosine aminotransferase [Desulfitobacterium sp. LBE]|uniref:aminotransferase class I/II-fold pyridoxal phosphate-dependent enzyme n=1 Tax=Desulfitobacterium TaxID=36853 RepID=UPI00036EF70E|nr:MULTISPECIES: aminotransferase class I/II-fold pyridoxal phosphate-dependent enzyme [Desulfitobacterium]TWH56208.1 aspartate/methionine/tyrosine aminotransferase [Desulfitobacterium sp. LBE]